VTFGTQVWSQGIAEGREGHARAQARNAALRKLRQEGEKPEAGDRDRALRGASGRRKSSETGIPVSVGRELSLAIEPIHRPLDQPLPEPFQQPLAEPLVESLVGQPVDAQPFAGAWLELAVALRESERRPQPQPVPAVVVRRKEAVELAPLSAPAAGPVAYGLLTERHKVLWKTRTVPASNGPPAPDPPLRGR